MTSPLLSTVRHKIQKQQGHQRQTQTLDREVRGHGQSQEQNHRFQL